MPRVTRNPQLDNSEKNTLSLRHERSKQYTEISKKDLARKEPEAKLLKDHDLKKVVAASSDREQDPTLKNDEIVKNGLVKEIKPDKPSNNQHQHSDDPSRSRYKRRSRSRSITRNSNGRRSQSPRNALKPKPESPLLEGQLLTHCSPSRSPRRNPKKVTSLAPSRSSSRSRSRSSSPVGQRDAVKKVASMAPSWSRSSSPGGLLGQRGLVSYGDTSP
ncbi:hypothetical protein Tco_0206771 [Tanacetum coccineum]